MNTISVIGGGISALYYKYKNLDKDIIVYESSDRFGGRLMTMNHYGIDTEYGALRYEWGYQPTLESLLYELDVDVISFPSYCGNSCEHITFIREVCEYIWSLYFHRDVNIMDITNQDMREIHKEPWLLYNDKHVYIYDINFDEYIYYVNNPEWCDKMKIMDHDIRTFPINGWSLLLWVLRWTKLLISNHEIKTVRGGNQEIISSLMKKIPSDDVQLGYKLYKIDKMSDYYKLYFTNGEVRLTREIMLTIPIDKINKIEYNFPEKTRYILSKMNPYKIGRIFIYVKDPFWTEEQFHKYQNYKSGELNTREVYYYRRGDIGLIMLYFDEIYFKFWKHKSVNEIREHIIGCGFCNIIDIKTFYWDGYENTNAFHYLEKGVDPSEAIDVLYNSEDHFHIVGDCTFEPGFMEGSLEIIQSKL
jgi:hypothetical protein